MFTVLGHRSLPLCLRLFRKGGMSGLALSCVLVPGKREEKAVPILSPGLLLWAI